MATRTKIAPVKKTAAAADAPTFAKVQLPEGFTPIVGEFGTEWKYEEMPLLVGVVTGDVRTYEKGTPGTKNYQRSEIVNVVNDEDGVIYSVWESAALRGWIDAVKNAGPDGVRVAVAFQGYKPMGKGKNDMKVFVGSISTDMVPTAPRAHPNRASERPAATRAPVKAAAKKSRAAAK